MSDYEARFSHIRKGDACIYLLQEDKSRLRQDAVPRCKIGKATHLDHSFKESRMQNHSIHLSGKIEFTACDQNSLGSNRSQTGETFAEEVRA